LPGRKILQRNRFFKNDKMKLSKTITGHLQIEIVHDCDYDKFYSIAELIKKQLGIIFINKIDGFDSLFWDFEFNNQLYNLDYNIYLGVSVSVIESKLSSVE
jgi:hypothetical protein